MRCSLLHSAAARAETRENSHNWQFTHLHHSMALWDKAHPERVRLSAPLLMKTPLALLPQRGRKEKSEWSGERGIEYHLLALLLCCAEKRSPNSQRTISHLYFGQKFRAVREQKLSTNLCGNLKSCGKWPFRTIFASFFAFLAFNYRRIKISNVVLPWRLREQNNARNLFSSLRIKSFYSALALPANFFSTI
jgi:hypothetical protein